MPAADLPAAHPPHAPGRGLARLLRFKIAMIAGCAALILGGVYLALLWAPTLSAGFSAPVAQRIFYFHLGAAITSYTAFTVALAASAAYLRTRNLFYDVLARDSATLALLFTLMVLTSGPLWGWAEWGVAWRFEDARLDAYLVLALVFVGYFALRRSIPDALARARSAASYAIVGYILVPVSYFSIYLWQSLHPRVISPGGQGVGSQGAMVLAVTISGFVLLFVALLLVRLDLSLLEARVARLQLEVDAA